MKKKPAICLMGVTCAGKTQIAIELTQRLPCDIISVDSSQVYRGLDIGTAKPTAAEQKLAPHRLIDIRDLGEKYSAGDFRRDAIREIEQIHAQDRIPLLVGGTMLYFKVLQQGLAKLPTANTAIRKKIELDAQKYGWPKLHQKLDSEAAARISPNDSQRIQRALEVYDITGKTITELFKQQQTKSPYNFINFALAPASKTILYERITQRFDQMLADRLIDECRRGDPCGRPWADTGVRPYNIINYKQVGQYLQGELTYDEMREQAIIATRQLAKRQMTWLRNWPNVTWFDTETVTVNQILKIVNNTVELP